MGIEQLQFSFIIAGTFMGVLVIGILLGMLFCSFFCNAKEILTMFRELREKKKQSTNVSPPERDRE